MPPDRTREAFGPQSLLSDLFGSTDTSTLAWLIVAASAAFVGLYAILLTYHWITYARGNATVRIAGLIYAVGVLGCLGIAAGAAMSI